jgi:hypothetical protein
VEIESATAGVSVVVIVWSKMNKELKLLLISFVLMLGCIVYFYFQQKGG